jgi:hypothetical protein
MKNIIVYIAIFIMMMPGLSLSAEVNFPTNQLFERNHTPFNNNPFDGENPTKIKRNLNVNIQYKFDFNHNNLHNNHNKKVSYLNSNDKTNYNTNRTFSLQNTEIRRYNTPLNNNNTENITVTYGMTSTIKAPKINEVFETKASQNTTPSQDDNYKGSGAPSTYKVPIGNATIPFMLLLVAIYCMILRYKK